MRTRASTAAAALALAGAITAAAAPATPTLKSILDRPGANVGAIFGTNNYSTGDVRVSFLVVRNDGQVVYRPTASAWLAPTLASASSATTKAALEAVGVPGKGDPGDVQGLYVAHFRIAKPGTYWLVAEPDGAAPIQAYGQVVVRKRPLGPAVGSKAYPSETPTLASAHGDAASITTRRPPDVGLLRYSVADSLKAHAPFVLTFATPKFCTSRTCGPVVDVVDAVRKQFAGTDVRFIHTEIYKDDDPAKGTNRWVAEWRLPSEPWTFLVDRNGRIVARFEGSLSVRELAAAVHEYLG